MSGSGLRFEQVPQLRREDVKKLGEGYVAHLKPSAGSIKSGQARIVPLHDHLIELGFVEFVNSRGRGPLFLSCCLATQRRDRWLITIGATGTCSRLEHVLVVGWSFRGGRFSAQRSDEHRPAGCLPATLRSARPLRASDRWWPLPEQRGNPASAIHCIDDGIIEWLKRPERRRRRAARIDREETPLLARPDRSSRSGLAAAIGLIV